MTWSFEGVKFPKKKQADVIWARSKGGERELELPRCGKFNKAKQGAAGGRMKAELRETWYNVCVDCGVQENRWSGENFSDCCNVAPTERERWLLLHQRAKRARGVAWAHSYAAKHL